MFGALPSMTKTDLPSLSCPVTTRRMRLTMLLSWLGRVGLGGCLRYYAPMTSSRISVDPTVMMGKPCIEGTRITVELLLWTRISRPL
ncbi:DUF433 domain-containing protein [Reyranella sp.]|uniref:DUF433 domain-containing protein n=1 Tax=Reyranella sp. TaxID=1929291 RepID=UPI003D13437A